MKKKLLFYFLFSTLALASVDVKTISKNEETEKYKYEFSYPEFILNEKSLSVNNEIEKIVNDNIKGFRKEGMNNPHKNRPYEAKMIFKEFKNNFGITSTLVMNYFYTGGAHGTTGLTSYNINSETGKNLAFNDIFSKGAKKYFEQEIIKKIESELRKPLEKRDVNYFGEKTMRAVDLDNAVLFFRGNEFVIRYQQYAIAPYSEGTPEFTFTKEQIEKYLKI
ncbi:MULTISPECIES: DUF3298 and DUF4163 domain-containing protein [Fusobacterium]|uniref:DUF3298 and DUF4163 domain-containing protein n=1 Tax=Fusobacterium TaxID=848 RepID=UPI0014775E9D|nr:MULTISPECIES: DUF3298 and DUF4163 domain-containing protein [Fusobacterium]NME35183.1 DUF3298 and DUF4163 domain-containing protein [Fusobacterium sp. FSA-380-WT-3A]